MPHLPRPSARRRDRLCEAAAELDHPDWKRITTRDEVVEAERIDAYRHGGPARDAEDID